EQSRAEQSRAEQSRAEQSRAEQSRAEHIDNFRAFGIILMVMGHIGFGRHFDKFIHAFHMPMFFIVSGMFLSIKDEPSIFMKKKVKSLLLPYAFFGLFHYGVWIIQNWPEVDAGPLSHLLFINTDELPLAGALWFLTALFFAEIIYYLICKYVSSGTVQHLVVVAFAAFGCFATTVLPFRLPYALDSALVGVGLMHIGCMYKKHKENLHWIEELKVHEYLILGIITTVLIFVNGYINMRTGSYSIIPLFWINTVLATAVGINLAKYLVTVAPQWLRNYLASMGKNSIVYLCLNQLVILVVSHVLLMLALVSIVIKCLILINSLVGLLVLEKVIMNTKLKAVMGKSL
ncbi:acyltransferase family protein, partial [Enterocloster bolteae]